MKVKIHRVSHPGLMRAYAKVASQVYESGETPPTAGCTEKFSPFNPVLDHVRYANFVALIDGSPAGRITASIDSLNPRSEEGFWGCFECVDSSEVAGALLDAAAKWLREQGKTIMIGPASLNTNEQVGLLIKGFSYAPQHDVPYNPPYYQQILEESGLEREHDLECFKWELPTVFPGKLENPEPVPGLVIRPVNYRSLSREAVLLRDFHNSAMSGLWGHIPITLKDAGGFMESLARRVPPRLFLIAEVEGRLAGILLSIPGRDRDGTRFVRHAVGGIMPEFRRRGIPPHVLKESYSHCKSMGLIRGEGSQVAESNEDVKKRVINPLFGGEVIKIYRVYRRTLD